MSGQADPWYVRLPDGRTLRAESTEALRQSLDRGRIPWDSMARRSPDRAWLPLRRLPELSDLGPGDREPRLRPRGQTNGELHPIGVRVVVEELWSAVDSTLHRNKLIPAGLAGLVAAGAFIAAELTPVWLDASWTWPARLLAGGVLVLALSVCTSWLTQMTYIELARLRPARRTELRIGVFRFSLRLILMQGLVGLAFALPLIVLRWLWTELGAGTPGWHETLRSCLLAARLLWEVLGWPMFLMSLLLVGPMVVVEDYSVVRGLREWLGLVRQHLARIYLYEALAGVLGVVITLPLLLPIALAGGHVALTRGLNQVEEATLGVLLGLASTPLLAYLLVANVFIYLNLRYEFRPTVR